MGNENTSIYKRELYNLKNHSKINTINDNRYGNINIVKNTQTNQTYAEMTKTLNDEQQWTTRVSELRFRQQLDHPNLVKLINFSSEKKDEFCSTFYKLGVLYEYFSNDLKQELSQRKQFNLQYSQPEIWYLLESLVNVAHYLKTKDATHSDIRPYNVLIDNNRQVKLGEVYLNTQPFSSYTQLLQGMNQDFYISPQLMNGLKEQKDIPHYDRSKNEVFQIGMTVLEAATLENVSSTCYDSQQCIVKYDRIQQLLNQVGTQYSPQLAQTLQMMLLENEVQRSSFEQVLNITQGVNKTNSLSTLEIKSLLSSPEKQKLSPIKQQLEQPLHSQIQVQQPLHSQIQVQQPLHSQIQVQPITDLYQQKQQESYHIYAPDTNVQVVTTQAPQVITYQMPQIVPENNYVQYYVPVENQVSYIPVENQVSYIPVETKANYVPVENKNTYVQVDNQKSISTNIQPISYTYEIQQQPQSVQYVTTNYENEDLNQKIQAVLAMSKETVSRFGTTTAIQNFDIAPQNINNYAQSQNTTTITTTQNQAQAQLVNQQPGIIYTNVYSNNAALDDGKASQIQTRTFLNEKTNNIEIQNYIFDHPVKQSGTFMNDSQDNVKRNARVQQQYQQQYSNYQVAPQQQQQQQYVYYQNNSDYNDEVMNVQMTDDQRNAYIQKILAEVKTAQGNTRNSQQGKRNSPPIVNDFIDNAQVYRQNIYTMQN